MAKRKLIGIDITNGLTKEEYEAVKDFSEFVYSVNLFVSVK